MTQTTTKQAGERTQHTPEPWSYSPSVDSFVIRGGEYQTHIAQTYLRGEDDKANARLIAAAPELLTACKALLLSGEKMISHDDYVNQFGFSQEGAIDNALAAIAKAEGKAQ